MDRLPAVTAPEAESVLPTKLEALTVPEAVRCCAVTEVVETDALVRPALVLRPLEPKTAPAALTDPANRRAVPRQRPQMRSSRQ